MKKTKFYNRTYKKTKKGLYIVKKEIKEDLGIEIEHNGSVYLLEEDPYTGSLILKTSPSTLKGLLIRPDGYGSIIIKSDEP
jgi:hypothetical protein